MTSETATHANVLRPSAGNISGTMKYPMYNCNRIGRAADDLHNAVMTNRRRFEARHLADGQQRPDDCAKEYRDGRQQQRNADALDQKYLPVFSQELDDVGYNG